jgi:hypothetical protein
MVASFALVFETKRCCEDCLTFAFFAEDGAYMPYPAAAIANEFLELAKANGQALTPMQIQKLVYFAHGWNLAITGEPLIWERVEPWDYGPVVRNLYRNLREFGSGAITKSLEEKLDWNDIDDLPRRTPRIQGGDGRSSERSGRFMDISMRFNCLR